MSKVGLGIAAFAVVGVGLALTNVMTQEDAAPAAGHSMEPVDLSDIADGAPLVDVAVPAELTPEARIGQVAFEAVCSACHGINAAGQNGVAPSFVHITYEPNHHGDGAFLSAVRNGVQAHHWGFGNMPVIEGLTNGDVRAITQYVRELQRENGIF